MHSAPLKREDHQPRKVTEPLLFFLSRHLKGAPNLLLVKRPNFCPIKEIEVLAYGADHLWSGLQSAVGTAELTNEQRTTLYAPNSGLPTSGPLCDECAALG